MNRGYLRCKSQDGRSRSGKDCEDAGGRTHRELGRNHGPRRSGVPLHDGSGNDPEGLRRHGENLGQRGLPTHSSEQGGAALQALSRHFLVGLSLLILTACSVPFTASEDLGSSGNTGNPRAEKQKQEVPGNSEVPEAGSAGNSEVPQGGSAGTVVAPQAASGGVAGAVVIATAGSAGAPQGGSGGDPFDTWPGGSGGSSGAAPVPTYKDFDTCSCAGPNNPNKMYCQHLKPEVTGPVLMDPPSTCTCNGFDLVCADLTQDYPEAVWLQTKCVGTSTMGDVTLELWNDTSPQSDQTYKQNTIACGSVYNLDKNGLYFVVAIEGSQQISQQNVPSGSPAVMTFNLY